MAAHTPTTTPPEASCEQLPDRYQVVINQARWKVKGAKSLLVQGSRAESVQNSETATTLILPEQLRTLSPHLAHSSTQQTSKQEGSIDQTVGR